MFIVPFMLWLPFCEVAQILIWVVLKEMNETENFGLSGEADQRYFVFRYQHTMPPWQGGTGMPMQ